MPDCQTPMPNADCKLFIKSEAERQADKTKADMDAIRKTISDTAAIVAEATANWRTQGKAHKDLQTLVQGVNQDGGLVAQCRDHTNDIKNIRVDLDELKKLPEELRAMVRQWGFWMVGIIGAIMTSAGAINYFIIKTLIAKAVQ